jgi:hypothetical protein
MVPLGVQECVTVIASSDWTFSLTTLAVLGGEWNFLVGTGGAGRNWRRVFSFYFSLLSVVVGAGSSSSSSDELSLFLLPMDIVDDEPPDFWSVGLGSWAVASEVHSLGSGTRPIEGESSGPSFCEFTSSVVSVALKHHVEQLLSTRQLARLLLLLECLVSNRLRFHLPLNRHDITVGCVWEQCAQSRSLTLPPVSQRRSHCISYQAP